MGPPNLLSEVPSATGSGSSSDWGREYEDEDTWYEFTSTYQTGPETILFSSKDTGLSLRMEKYRRSATGPYYPPSIRSGLKERQDLRDLDKELEGDEALMASSTISSSLSRQLKGLATSTSAEGLSELFLKIIWERERDK